VFPSQLSVSVLFHSGLYISWVHSHTECDSNTSEKQISSAKAALKAIAEMQASTDRTKTNNALSFNDMPSSTFQLVVTSLTNEFSKGPTNDSPAKQRPVPNHDPAIESSLQLHVPMIVESIWQLMVALTFEQSIKMQPIFQLNDVSIPNKNDLCSVFQMIVHWQNTFIELISFNNSTFQLVVKFTLISNFEVAQVLLSMLIVGCGQPKYPFFLFAKSTEYFAREKVSAQLTEIK
jgi:hypothetical protein